MGSNSELDLDKAYQNLNNTASSAEYKKPSNIIDAVSKIQQYHVFEKEQTKDINKNFFTLRQFIDFFKIGFKNGFIESLIFVTMLPFFQTLYPSFKTYFLQIQYTYAEYIGLMLVSYVPIFLITVWLSALARLYDGAITKKAIFGLLLGRTSAFVIKAILVFTVFDWIYEAAIYDKDATYVVIDGFNKFFITLLHLDYSFSSDDLFTYYYMFIVPAIQKTAFEAAISMMIFASIPFFAVIIKGFYIMYKRKGGEIEYELY